MKMLELHYPMIQFLIINVTTGACGSNDSMRSKALLLSYLLRSEKSETKEMEYSSLSSSRFLSKFSRPI